MLQENSIEFFISQIIKTIPSLFIYSIRIIATDNLVQNIVLALMLLVKVLNCPNCIKLVYKNSREVKYYVKYLTGVQQEVLNLEHPNITILPLNRNMFSFLYQQPSTFISKLIIKVITKNDSLNFRYFYRKILF